jgi:predicted kinase
MTRIASAWVVAGAPGAGKSTVADLLIARLPGPVALLDKDTMYGGFVAAMLDRADRPHGEREGSWYDEYIKVHEYRGMAAVAAEVRAKGCPVLLSGPFTGQIHDAARWAAFVTELGGEDVHLIWVRSDPAILRGRLTARGLTRDNEKLRRFPEFLASMRLGHPPAVPHFEVDNRLDTPEDLANQVERVIAKLTITE